MRIVHEPAPVAGTFLGLGLVVAISAALVPFREGSGATPALVLVAAVVVAALVGGRICAVVTAAGAALAYNFMFIPPYRTLDIGKAEDLAAFVVFTGVGLAVGTLVASQADRRRVAEQRAHEVEVLNERYRIVQAERERLFEEATHLAVLEQVDRQRAALLRSVSHDLRTPLAAIEAVTSDLRAGAGYDEETRDELLDLVVGEAQRLDRIVGNLLSLSRIESGAFRPERQAVELAELVAECARRLERLFSRVSIDLKVPTLLPLVDADYSQIDQVVTNLLENASRHAPIGSTVRVTARPDEGAVVLVTVEDEGSGVPMAERAQVFEPFWHGENSTGSGAGLAICKAIVEAHGGVIGVHTSPSGGARFWFTLPVRSA